MQARASCCSESFQGIRAALLEALCPRWGRWTQRSAASATGAVLLICKSKLRFAAKAVILKPGWYGSIATAVEALRRGATNYVTKPATVDAIVHAFSERAEGAIADSELTVTPSLEQVEWEHI